VGQMRPLWDMSGRGRGAAREGDWGVWGGLRKNLLSRGLTTMRSGYIYVCEERQPGPCGTTRPEDVVSQCPKAVKYNAEGCGY